MGYGLQGKLLTSLLELNLLLHARTLALQGPKILWASAFLDAGY